MARFVIMALAMFVHFKGKVFCMDKDIPFALLCFCTLLPEGFF
jgi:hypothetical protein